MIISGDDPVSGGARRFEVFTGAGKRRDWTDAEKAPIVAECWSGGKRINAVARQHASDPSQIVTGTVEIPGTVQVKFPTLRFEFSGGFCGSSIFGWAPAASRLDGRRWRNQGFGPDVLGEQIGMPTQEIA
jgi:hypothetical protein